MQVVGLGVGRRFINLSCLKSIVKLYLSYSVYFFLLSGSLVVLPLTQHHSIVSFLNLNTML